MRSRNPLLITGFGPFLDIKENPSGTLAQHLGHPFQILEVTYEAADQFWNEFDPAEYESVLLLGVAAKAQKLRIEHVAHNCCIEVRDVRGARFGPGPIDPRLPSQLGATLWPAGIEDVHPDLEPSTDAGGYLCNYLLFRGLQLHSETRIGFLHVPPFEVVNMERQLDAVRAVIGRIEG